MIIKHLLASKKCSEGSMSMNGRQSIAMLAILLLVSPAASAYDYPLHSEAIRNAYFLGERNNFQTTDCLLQYIHRFTEFQTGRYYVTQIDISTPYQQIVLRAQRNTPGDSEVQTETDLQSHPLQFLVRVRVEWNATYTGGNPRTFSPWEFPGGSTIDVEQRTLITPQKTTYESVNGHHAPVGEIIELQFDPAKISSSPLRISVRTPDGETVETQFDMARIE